MKTSPYPNRQRGALLLVLIAIIAIVGICYFGWKIIDRLLTHPFDPNHGQGTNVTDTAWSGRVQELIDAGVTEVTPTNLPITVPVQALAYEWHYWVQTSTNLRDWTDTELEWNAALDLAATNHNEPMRFWRRELWW